MERRLGLAFTTLTIFAPLAQASHPKQAIQVEGTAAPLEFVATAPGPRGIAFARQVLPARVSAHATTERAQSRVIYLNHDGALLQPGDNDASSQRSTIVTQATLTNGWDVDDASWQDTVDCVAHMYAAFDVTVTDQDPGNVPHIEALIGGHPSDVGLADNVAGVSPFTTDCAIIENSIVFTFPDILPDDPQAVCEVVSQEIAHSFGLDHEMLPEDPMTYLEYAGPRAFQNEMASCGEYADRMCGINGNMCRQRQNSVSLLTQRLGTRTTTTGKGAGSGRDDNEQPTDDGSDDGGPTIRSPGIGGCAAANGGAGIAMALAMLGVCLRRRR